MDDVRAVMDAAGSERAAVLGVSEGGALAALFAATYPQRCQRLVLYGAFARFPDAAEVLEPLLQVYAIGPGGTALACRHLPRRARRSTMLHWWGRFERLGASPAGGDGGAADVPPKRMSAISFPRYAYRPW